MKKLFGSFLGALLVTSLVAQTTNTPPAIPATTSAPPAKAESKAAPKKKAATAKKAPGKTSARKLAEELRTVPLIAGPASVIASNVNIRGKAGFVGEVLFRINKGDTVTVIEEVRLKNSKDDEPSAWAKIALPSGAHAWVNTSFVDATSKTVKPKKLNVRGGPGENYSIIGTIERGAPVKEISVKGDWTEIEPPPGAFAFVAAQYLKQEAPAIVATTPAPVEPAPITTPVTEPAPVAPTTTDVAPPVTPTPPTLTPDTIPEPSDEPPPRRIIEHEGIVKGTVSVQAPTRFALVSPQTGKTINYLYTTSTNLDLSRYKGLHIVVTGEEGLDERWVNTPIITIQRILVLE
jgi:uncharacterized protein YgiM (DUF1202 family)